MEGEDPLVKVPDATLRFDDGDSGAGAFGGWFQPLNPELFFRGGAVSLPVVVFPPVVPIDLSLPDPTLEPPPDTPDTPPDPPIEGVEPGTINGVPP